MGVHEDFLKRKEKKTSVTPPTWEVSGMERDADYLNKTEKIGLRKMFRLTS
jgi:hypothetical protein